MSVHSKSSGTLNLASTSVLAAILSVCLFSSASCQEIEKNDANKEKSDRAGYIIKVPLPIVGNRDADVSRQIRQLSEAVRDGSLERPIVVLQFQASSPENGNEPGTSRGSQFERCLALARSITDRESSNLRIVAYLPESVEGHAVLPILACQEIYASPRVELGRAAIDSESDATVRAAYQDITSRGRTNIPSAAVEAMLTPNLELFRISTVDSASQVATRAQLEQLKKDGQLLQEEGAIWNKLGLAAFTAKQMREWLWISPEVQNPTDLAKALGLEGGLRTVQQLPREWKAATVRISDTLDREKTNQIIRSIQEATSDNGVNLLVFLFDAAKCDFDEATRLANAIGELREKVYTVAFIQESLTGPIGLAAISCGEAVLIGDSTLGPDLDLPQIVAEGNAEQRVLTHIASFSQRPLPLMSVIVDKDAEAIVYTHQKSGRRDLMTEGQVARHNERENWFPNAKVAGRGEIPQEVALQYGLVNAVEKSTTAGLSRLGIEQLPEEVSSPWLDSVIQKIRAFGWLPRILLMFGLMALMIELGNPGIGIGGLTAGLCFLGFFWIEGLNGNVEWLEILLFLGGLFALAIELFLLPGFGVFGVTGLLMVFLSLVLAGQTFVWPGTSAEVTTLASNLFWVAFLGFAGMVGLLFMHQRLEKLPMFRWLSLSPGGTDELEQLEQRESIVSYDYLLGQLGTTKTRLNPSGKAQFADDIISVVGSGGLIDEGVPVQVVEVRGNLVIVEECT